MKHSARGLACIVFGAVACSAAAAQAGSATSTPEIRPVALTEAQMDEATAGANWRSERAARFLSHLWQRLHSGPLNSGPWWQTPGTGQVQGLQSSSDNGSSNGSNNVSRVSYNRSYQYTSSGN